mgnify:CR=1 FL=1
MVEVVVGEGYRIAIPEEICKRLGVKVGDRLIVEVEEGRIVLKPLRLDALERLMEIADKYLGGPRSIDAVRFIEETLEAEIDEECFADE